MTARYLVAVLLTLATPGLHAACGVSVSASASAASSTVTVSATSVGNCGNSTIVVNAAGAERSKNCDAPSCSGIWTLPTYCLRTGTHIVTATAFCLEMGSNGCDLATPGTATTSGIRKWILFSVLVLAMSTNTRT
jgi:hypothetical protein